IIVPTLLGSIALAVILALHVSNIQAQYGGGGPTLPQQPILAKFIIKYTCIQTPQNAPEFGLEKGRYSTNISILHYNKDTILTVKHTIVQSVRAPDHNSQIIETADDIPFIASVEIDCMYIVEKAGEGTGWIIIEAPQEDKIQVKAVHTSNRDMEMEDVPLR
ncbi:MAG: hypothetical protein ACRD5H_14590, partial [Nitrososphaerales archaeon]